MKLEEMSTGDAEFVKEALDQCWSERPEIEDICIVDSRKILVTAVYLGSPRTYQLEKSDRWRVMTDVKGTPG